MRFPLIGRRFCILRLRRERQVDILLGRPEHGMQREQGNSMSNLM
jgi:hypothetical protein